MYEWIYEADIRRLREQLQRETDERLCRKLRHYIGVAEWRLEMARQPALGPAEGCLVD
ncbi:hypothetical protein [Sphingomonas sp. ID0503]|uniref:hypothetical protein n=1 Tax=Sphingomonas sp. ID0503 TaxID=3399691 RepID=UPI003AFB15B2